MKLRAAAVFLTILAGGCAASNGPAPAPLAPSAAPAEPVKAATSTPPPAGASYDSQIVARINTKPITMGQLVGPLIDTYGLNMLLNIVQLELAKDNAASAKVTVTPEDIAKERELTLSRLFGNAKKEDYHNLLNQFLSQKGMKKQELDLVIEQQAYLHKIAEPMVHKQITDENVQEAFRSLYGETVHVKHIECANLQDIAEAKRRLAAGESFELVAKTMSNNGSTAPLGGDLPPFSRAAANYPQAFK
ncbi:MAG TPA: hypothetical protein VL282_12630, partial [Tepidisphaeraceae bacterium]|nr:hypothetical protein [Tepidisphaeraceae bacterium]